MAILPTPLCPAGHLPRKGGDWLSLMLSPIADAARGEPAAKLPISPLAGEMAGRPEGGVTERDGWSKSYSNRSGK
ncbi:MAG: hypothetical protein E5W70_21435 [Mesorhizobium sp.]|nr:MAG: hypothetical protein E5W70_21435 [Mesorhizobium sp.]